MASDLTFTDSKYYCILFADMVGSTLTSARITNSSKLRTFYGIFINTLSEVAEHFDARVIKTAGDSIICFFPETMDCGNKPCFKKVVECGLAMIECRDKINSKLEAEKLPTVSYRISIDYGKHEVVTADSTVRDLFGTTMNMCSKINSLAPPNSLVIGNDLYEIVKSMQQFTFEQAGHYNIGLKFAYPVFSVLKRR